MSKERELLQEVLNQGYFSKANLFLKIKELLDQPETITPREGLVEFKKGYMIGHNAAVMDLKQKVDNVFNALMEEDDE